MKICYKAILFNLLDTSKTNYKINSVFNEIVN